MDSSPEQAVTPLTNSEAALMARNGIRCIPANYYYVDGYRYTVLADALAQASRTAGTAQPAEERPEEEHQPPTESEAALMARNGIRCVPANYYYVDGYRYTTLADALAQAARTSGHR